MQVKFKEIKVVKPSFYLYTLVIIVAIMFSTIATIELSPYYGGIGVAVCITLWLVSIIAIRYALQHIYYIGLKAGIECNADIIEQINNLVKNEKKE